MCWYEKRIKYLKFQYTSYRSIESQSSCTIRKPFKASDCTIPPFHLCINFTISFDLIKVFKIFYTIPNSVNVKRIKF